MCLQTDNLRNLTKCVCVYESVFVCVCEREREGGEGGKERPYKLGHTGHSSQGSRQANSRSSPLCCTPTISNPTGLILNSVTDYLQQLSFIYSIVSSEPHRFFPSKLSRLTTLLLTPTPTGIPWEPVATTGREGYRLMKDLHHLPHSFRFSPSVTSISLQQVTPSGLSSFSDPIPRSVIRSW